MKPGSFLWKLLPLQASQVEVAFPSRPDLAQSLEVRLGALWAPHSHSESIASFEYPALFEACAIKLYPSLPCLGAAAGHSP